MKKTIISMACIALISNACQSEDSDKTPVANEERPVPGELTDTNSEDTSTSTDSTEGLALNEGQATIKHLVHSAVKASSSFQLQSKAFHQNVIEFCQAPSQQSREMMQAGFKALNQRWQYLDAIKLGPLMERQQELRYQVYAWPSAVTSSCRIDLEVLKSEVSPDYQLSSKMSQKGLGALEYLVFTGKEHSCRASMTGFATWNDRSQNSVDLARCSYLKLLSSENSSVAMNLEQRMTSYEKQFGDWSKLDITSVQNLLQEFSNSYFFLDTVVKDRKIGLAAGLKPELCPRKGCNTLVEQSHSELSKDSITANLQAFNDIFSGPDNGEAQKGFYHLLESKGAIALASRMVLNLENAISNLKSEGRSLFELAEESGSDCSAGDDRSICQHYSDVKTVTDDLKGEFLEILKLKAPKSAQGDSD